MSAPPVRRMVIRLARADERDACAGIYLAGRRVAMPWLPPESFALDDFDAAVVGEELWVARNDGHIRAFASIDRPGCFIHNLFVDPPFRGAGFGQALLRAICDTLEPPVELKCAERNMAARTFYENEGWAEISRGRQDGETYVLYRK